MRSRAPGSTACLARVVPLSMLLAAVIFPAGAPIASANHSALSLVSIGPSGGSGALDARFAGTSGDGRVALFYTDESLVPADTDTAQDVYSRSGGDTELVSTGSTGGNGGFDATGARLAEDGSTMFFQTRESLTASDTDGTFCFDENSQLTQCLDVYAHAAGVTTLVSSGGNGAFDAQVVGASGDGAHVYFITAEPLVAADTDTKLDIYESSGGAPGLVTAGTAQDAFVFAGASRDGSHVLFRTGEQLSPADTDIYNDVYDRSGGTTTLVSTGPAGGNGAFNADVPALAGAVSASGARIFLETAEQLVSADKDTAVDVYERSGGATTLVSNGKRDVDATFAGASEDGAHAFFTTAERILTSDGDMSRDVYERFGGAITLVSGGSGPFDAAFASTSAAGDRVLFETAEQLVAADTDSVTDVYERAAGATALLSIGPAGGNGPFAAAYRSGSRDATRVFFLTSEALTGADGDASQDVYERFGGATTLISSGPAGGSAALDASMSPLGASHDGLHVFFETAESLLATDADGARDVYDSSVAYQTPQSAGAVTAALVPLFRQCGSPVAPNAAHSAPLAVASCSPPAPSSTIAYVGAASTGSAQLSAISGDAATAADDADVAMQVGITDVRAGGVAGADFDPNPGGPDMTLALRARITDSSNGAGADPATLVDLDLSAPVDCAGTADPGIGAACSGNTTLDALTPGAVREGAAAVFQAFRLRLHDPGANGVPGDSDDRIFATQGVLAP